MSSKHKLPYPFYPIRFSNLSYKFNFGSWCIYLGGYILQDALTREWVSGKKLPSQTHVNGAGLTGSNLRAEVIPVAQMFVIDHNCTGLALWAKRVFIAKQ